MRCGYGAVPYERAGGLDVPVRRVIRVFVIPPRSWWRLWRFRGARLRHPRRLAPLAARQRADHHVQITVPKHFRWRIGPAMRRGFLHKTVHHFKAELLMGFLTASKAQLDPNFHILAQKCDGM